MESLKEAAALKLAGMTQMKGIVDEMMMQQIDGIKDLQSALEQISTQIDGSSDQDDDEDFKIDVNESNEDMPSPSGIPRAIGSIGTRLYFGIDGEGEIEIDGKPIDHIPDGQFCSEVDKMVSVLVPAHSHLRVERIDDSMPILSKMREGISVSDVHHRIVADTLETQSLSQSMEVTTNKCKKRKCRNKDVVHPSKQETKKLLKTVAKNALFAQLTKKERKYVISWMHKEDIQRGEVLIREGEINSMFYVVQSGTFAISTKKDGLMDTVGPDDLLGEDALIYTGPATHTVRAETQAMVWAIYQSTMRRKMRKLSRKKGRKSPIISRFMDKMLLLKQSTKRKENEQNEEFELKQDSTVSPVSSPSPNGLSLAHLEDFGMIGIGGFGVVHLVRDPNINNVFALKTMRKDLIVKNNQQKQIRSELKTLRRLDNPFVTMLQQTFKDRFNVYFMCEVGMGGDFLHYLRSIDHLTPRQIQFYAACVVEALAYLHSLNIVYRDMKPENMVLGVDGYLKLTDFGLTKSLDKGDTFTFCGTKDYMAPEVIVGRGYGLAVDWWGLGILIYEMTACHPPFQGDGQETYALILNQGVVYSPANRRFTDELQDLINNLCTKEPKERLGNGQGGAQSVRDHRWFRQMSFDWVALQNKTMRAPYFPPLSHDADMQNFKQSLKNPHTGKPLPVDNPAWAKDF